MYTMVSVILDATITPKRYVYTGFGDCGNDNSTLPPQKAPKRYAHNGFGDVAGLFACSPAGCLRVWCLCCVDVCRHVVALLCGWVVLSR